jgi:purine-nucleoside phosphorylase
MTIETQISTQYDLARRAAEAIVKRTKHRPKIGIILGSGLGAFAESLTDATMIPFSEIENFPHSAVVGHAGKLIVGLAGGRAGNIPIAAMQGRVHFYEGHSMQQVVFPIRVLHALDCEKAIITNAAGGISEKLEPGCLVVLTDHINLQGTNPLIGPNDERLGARFFDMSFPYHAPFREIAMREGLNLGIKMHEGVYLAVSGPSYETPAEIRAFRILGADVVGMSTVPEVIAARHMGMKILAISCVTNLAAGRSPKPLVHEEVLEVGARIRGQFTKLLETVVPLIEKAE